MEPTAVPTDSRSRLLIVDDETANIILLEKILKRAGYEDVIGTTNPLEALSIFDTNVPDLVLLDLSMPQMDGLEVMRHIRKKGRDQQANVPILVLTADATSGTKKEALTSGANDFVTKPFDHEEILARVANLLEARRLHLELARQNDRLEEEVRARVRELKETEGRLFQSQKMDAVGQLAGGIAHDFNNLLAVIINYTFLLLEDMDPSDPLREEVKEIQRAGESAATLTRQLLAFSRKEPVRNVILDLNEIVRGTQKLLHRTIGENIQIVVDLAQDLAPAKLDPGQLQQLLLNLAVNARDAMPDGGTLSIKTFGATMDAEFAAGRPGAYEGDYVCLQVSDTGTGMTEEVKARLFEPFFTTKERGVGTGLGMATVYGVVKQAGGYIDVASALGEGSTFTIYFKPTSEILTSVSSSPRPDRSRGEDGTILVVEDAPDLRRLIERLLVRNGFEVLVAEDGAEALARAEAHEGPIHLLLTDVIMPGMSGSDLSAAFSSLYPDASHIYMSGYTAQAIGNGNDLGEERFLGKPFTEPELIGAVNDALRASRDEGGVILDAGSL